MACFCNVHLTTSNVQWNTPKVAAFGPEYSANNYSTPDWPLNCFFFEEPLRRGRGAPAFHLRRIELTRLMRKTGPENRTTHGLLEENWRTPKHDSPDGKPWASRRTQRGRCKSSLPSYSPRWWAAPTPHSRPPPRLHTPMPTHSL